MNPKEKAKNIYKKYFEIVYKYMNHSSDDIALLVKELTINDVEDRILFAPYSDNNYAEWILDEETEYYWMEVKQEVNKL